MLRHCSRIPAVLYRFSQRRFTGNSLIRELYQGKVAGFPSERYPTKNRSLSAFDHLPSGILLVTQRTPAGSPAELSPGPGHKVNEKENRQIVQ